MATLNILDSQGKTVSEVRVSEGLIDGPVRKTLLWEVIKMQRANHRSGSASTKTRSMVKGSTRKIYRQKGSGNARHGDIKAPIFVGGGKVWGPHPRDYSYKMPRQSRLSALKSALALKYQDGNLKVIEEFPLKEIKTKRALEIFTALGATKALLVIAEKDLFIEKSVRNLKSCKVLRAEGINVYDLLRYDQVFLTSPALKKIEEMIS